MLPEDKQTALEIAAAAAGYEPMTTDEAMEPADTSNCNRKVDQFKYDPGSGERLWPHVRWNGDWYPVPTMGELEDYVLDSVCPSVDYDDDVEPDAPESWLSVLGMI